MVWSGKGNECLSCFSCHTDPVSLNDDECQDRALGVVGGKDRVTRLPLARSPEPGHIPAMFFASATSKEKGLRKASRLKFLE